MNLISSNILVKRCAYIGSLKVALSHTAFANTGRSTSSNHLFKLSIFVLPDIETNNRIVEIHFS